MAGMGRKRTSFFDVLLNVSPRGWQRLSSVWDNPPDLGAAAPNSARRQVSKSQFPAFGTLLE